jgi:hypothetical protein
LLDGQDEICELTLLKKILLVAECSVADPYDFGPDPDQTSEKNRIQILLDVKFVTNFSTRNLSKNSS